MYKLLIFFRPLFKKPYQIIYKYFYGYPSKIEAIAVNQKNLFLLNNQILLGKIDQKKLFQIQEYGVFSQHGEDGILASIFSKIGTTNRTFVEFGIDQGKECNSANLSINFGWNGLLLEKVKANTEEAKLHYKQLLDEPSKVKIVQSTVTAENINQTIKKNNIVGEIDLLSIDIDGNDYWVWKKISIIKPRVVAIEYNAIFGPKRSITIKYDPNFFRFDKNIKGLYYGASLKALAKLGKTKGYSLIYCDSSGTNAFFVRDDVAKKNYKNLSVDEAYVQSYYSQEKLPTTNLFKTIKNFPFVKI